MSQQSAISAFDPLPTEEQWDQVMQSELVDQEGQTTTFKQATQGKRVIAIFIRHWWCINCHTYVSKLSTMLPSATLPHGTSVIVIGCGDYPPIKAWKDTSNCAYPVYGNPSLSIYEALRFVNTLKGSKPGEEKEYEKDLGSNAKRILKGFTDGPMRYLWHMPYRGPDSQNGGELIVEADGHCSFVHRMEHTADHMELKDLVKVIGGEHAPTAVAFEDVGPTDASCKEWCS